MKFRLLILGLMIIVLNLIACDTGGEKKFYAKPSSLDFGDVYLGAQKELEVVLHSNSDSNISITKIEIVGSTRFTSTSTNISSIIMFPGSEFKIVVKYIPNIKSLDEAVMKVTHSLSEKTLDINISGTGTTFGIIEVSDIPLEFKDVIINQTLTKTVEIENTGIDLLHITQLEISGTDASLFNITAGGLVPIDIQPNAIHAVSILFTPSTLGQFTANLEIKHDGINEETPLNIEIMGEAIDADPQISLNQTSPWSFGTVATSLCLPETLVIENTGTDPLRVREIKLQNATAFSILSIYVNYTNIDFVPQNIPVGEKLFVDIEFEPTADIQYDDKLIINHNGTNESRPLIIDLTGTGVIPAIHNFAFTGASQQFTIPAGVHVIKTELWGAEGGGTYPVYTGTDPGKGGYVSGLIKVTPGDTLEIYVGGKGADGVLGAGGIGGWNGGGEGGTYPGPQQFGGGGGGASDIRINGITVYDRIIVAGAGGGAAAHMTNCDGGDGGGLEAKPGLLSDVFQIQLCGGGGTQIYYGTMAYIPVPLSFPTFGNGGDAIHLTHVVDVCGGGGGAGYWGGGAGSEGGGGGGSSYTDPYKFFKIQHQQGIHIGDGKIKITY